MSERPRARAAFRRLRFTREGWYFIALTLLIGFAAINSGNNLLYLVLGMLLSMIVASGILSESTLRGLSVSRRIPERIFAGQAVLMGIALRNTKRRLPSFSIETEDVIANAPLDKKCYFLKVPAGRTQRTAYRHTFPRRGAYRFTGFRASTRFPFTLFHKARRLASQAEVVVYPPIHPLAPAQLRAAEMGERLGARRSRRGDFYSLRDYRDGDDPRDIFWRKSASLGRPVIRETEDPAGRRIAVFFDNTALETVLSPDDLDVQEHAVSRAASLVAHYLARGNAVGLITRTASVAPGAGPGQLDRALRALALLEFVPADPPRPFAVDPKGARFERVTVTARGEVEAA